MLTACSKEKSILTLEQVSFVAGKKKLINNISFSIPAEKKVALVGLNGAGKSSLIRLLVGELPTTEGTVSFQDCRPLDAEFKKKLGYQASNMQAIENLTAREYLMLCCLFKKASKPIAHASIDRTIELWKLNSFIEQPMQQLSEGNLQKLCIAQAFLLQPEIIILDEPTQTLDPVEQQRFVNNLNVQKDYKLCLFSSHHINETVEAANLVLMLHHGSLIALMELDALDEYWFVSDLTEAEIVAFTHQNISLKQCFKNKKRLFCLRVAGQNGWKDFVVKLSPQDHTFIDLGNAKQALMPLFALLANEQI